MSRHSPDSGTDQGHGLAFGPQAQQMSPRTAAGERNPRIVGLAALELVPLL